MSRKNIDALGINYTVSRENKTANHFDFARISVRHQKTADIELVVRKEDSTSNRRLSSLNFNLSLSLSLSLSLQRAVIYNRVIVSGFLEIVSPGIAKEEWFLSLESI